MSRVMDKFIIASGLVYFIADVLAAASFAHTDWLRMATELGKTSIGLTKRCDTLYLREERCYKPDLPTSWLAVKVFLAGGIVGLTAATLIVISAHWKRERLIYARWTSLYAMMCLACVGVLFPLGFGQDSIGGSVMRLPEIWRIGYSYTILWAFSIIFCFLGWIILMCPLRNLFN